jgi:hypothetical protein
MAPKMASKHTNLSAINRGGVVTLADGTCWHISTSELSEAKSWRMGAEVMIQSRKLTNVETGVQVNVVPIPLCAELEREAATAATVSIASSTG